jgi:PAS domain S-box-containing protein
MLAGRSYKRVIGGVAFFILGITLIILSLKSINKNTEEFVEKKQSEKQYVLAHHIKGNIKNSLDHISDTLHTLKHSRIVPFAAIDREKEDPEKALRRLAGEPEHAVVKNIHLSKHYIRYYITDVSGEPLLTGEDKDGALLFDLAGNNAKTGHFPLAGKKAVNRDIGFLPMRTSNTEIAKKVIDAFTPVFDNGKHSGWLVLTFDIELIYETLFNAVGEEDHNWMYDDNGKLIFCTLIPTQEYHQKEIDELLQTSSNSIRISAHEDNNVTDLLTKIPLEIGDNKLNLVVETDFDYVISYLNKQEKIGALLLSTLFGLVYLVIYIFSRNKMTKEMADKTAGLLEKVSISEKKYRTIFEATADPVFLLGSNTEIIDLNREAELVFQKNRNELLGVSIKSIIPMEEPDPKKRNIFQSTQGELRVDHTIKSNGGKIMHFTGVYNSVENSDGTGNMILAHLHNITDQKEFEITLSSEKEALDMMVSSIGAGMALYTRDLTLERCNKEYSAIFPRAAVGKSFRSDGYDLVEKSLNENIQCREEREVDFGNEKRHYIFSTTPVKDRLGDTINVIELLLNITEQKRLQIQLQHNEKLASIGELVAGIAHEINNPLAGIIGYSELLAGELKAKSAKDDAKKILKEAKRCSKIISNLLTFSATSDNEKTSLSVKEPVFAALDIIDYEITTSGIAVEKNIAQDIPDIYGNLFELQQVFLNILTNAYYYLNRKMGEKRLWVSIKREEGNIEVDIENNGEKIPDENIENVFDPFFTSKVVGVGTGLGLSISHGIIKTHKGEITALNTKRGVRFTVTLPVYTAKKKN